MFAYLCVCVCVWVNHVPGFTATQGHHLQPHHRSARDSSIPDQQKVRHSQEATMNRGYRREPRGRKGDLSPPFFYQELIPFLLCIPVCACDSISATFPSVKAPELKHRIQLRMIKAL